MTEESLLVTIRARATIEDARKTIRLAEFRCIPSDRLIERVHELVSDTQASDVVYSISERDLTVEQIHALAKALRSALQEVDRRQGIDRGRLDRQIGRLLNVLPADLSRPIAIECISHTRKSRRTAGLRCLSVDIMDEDIFRHFIDSFDKTGDKRIIKALLSHPIRLECINPTRLLTIFEDDEYWQARAIEAILRADRNVGLRLALAHPVAFVWAAGRLGDTKLLPAISHCLEASNDKLRIFGIVAWAYGKLRASTELRALRNSLKELEQRYSLESE